ncbi:MAG TPA: oligopeptide ABC transporter permease [Thermomicrobiales bacterium]|nr:oligopeptide ABC transporter permease [Thermomicrobiales bacterium]
MASAALDERAEAAPGALGRARPIESPARRAIRRFLRHRVAVTGLVLLAVIAVLAIFAPLVGSYNPTEIDLRARNQGPSLAHWFGTDRTGRDTFARTVYAGRISLAVGVAAVAISASIGALLGAVAGYFGGFADGLIMRFTDVIMTFPAIVIILTAAAIVGPGLVNTILIIGLLGWPTPCRLVRARFLSLRDQEFIQAARALGAPTPAIIVRHAFPNCLDVLIVYASLGVATAILLEAGLSFLGLGIQPPTPSWGNLLNVARDVSVLENQPWQWMPAGAAIVLTVLAVNFIGDGLRDALDPRAVS